MDLPLLSLPMDLPLPLPSPPMAPRLKDKSPPLISSTGAGLPVPHLLRHKVLMDLPLLLLRTNTALLLHLNKIHMDLLLLLL